MQRQLVIGRFVRTGEPEPKRVHGCSHQQENGSGRCTLRSGVTFFMRVAVCVIEHLYSSFKQKSSSHCGLGFFYSNTFLYFCNSCADARVKGRFPLLPFCGRSCHNLYVEQNCMVRRRRALLAASYSRLSLL